MEVARITGEAKAERARIKGEAEAEMARIKDEAKGQEARLQDKVENCHFYLRAFGTRDHEPLKEALSQQQKQNQEG